MNDSKTLHYVLLKPRQDITANLFEAEKYEAAVVVQQLIGNLVYYSNFGRYEPRLAESWETHDGTSWKFKIKSNSFAENGEAITPKSFKQSIERALLILEKNGGVPILPSLKGFREFIKSNENIPDVRNPSPLAGLVADSEYLTFNFEKKIKSGLLQILSFSPLGYVSAENFDSKGNWKDNTKFISSGPYKLKDITIGSKYTLEKNKYWQDFAKNSPDIVIFTHDDKAEFRSTPVIIDAFTNEYSNEKFATYQLVPEYINSVLLGNLSEGLFSKQSARDKFKVAFNEQANKILPLKFGINTRSTSYYPNQRETKNDIKTPEIVSSLPKSSIPLLIEGDVPPEGSARGYAWKVLKATLEDLEIPYKFAKNESSFEEMTNRKYDIRIRGASIGGGVEAWGLYVAFCSSVGINFPDPGKEVCTLVERYDNDQLTDEELASQFLSTVDRQAAILPVSHFGVQLFISENIDTKSFSPLLAIMKFDQISIGN